MGVKVGRSADLTRLILLDLTYIKEDGELSLYIRAETPSAKLYAVKDYDVIHHKYKLFRPNIFSNFWESYRVLMFLTADVKKLLSASDDGKG